MDALRILIIDDEEIVCRTLGDYLRQAGHDVDAADSGSAGFDKAISGEYDLVITDIRMPGMDGLSLLARFRETLPELSVVVMTGHGSMDAAVQALRLGAADFFTKPIKLVELDPVLERCRNIRALREDKRRLRISIKGIQQSSERRGDHRFIGVGSATKRVIEQIEQVVDAQCDTVLVVGETGTGKEVVAREIHFRAMSAEAPFVAASCPAMSDSLVESELFGHVKGAFTGAINDKAGVFEQAHGGTLFLDEIADLSPAAQAKMLRVLESRTIRRVGGDREIPIDIRVIAATNASLEKQIAEGKFREDLYYRLNVFCIALLPLRERREDILPLAEHFLTTYISWRGISPPEFSGEARKLLTDYDYPGNARELRNIVERAVILCGDGPIEASHISVQAMLSVSASSDASASSRFSGSGAADPDETNPEHARVLNVLEDCKWNRRKAASKLGISYSALRYRMQKYAIS